MALALLIASLAGLFWLQRNDVKNFAVFAEIVDTKRRQRTFRIWAAKSCAFYLGVPLAGLALLGRLDAIWFWHIPSEFWPLAMPLPLIQPRELEPFLVGVAIGLVIVGIAFLIRGRRPPRPSKALKIAPLMARNRAEALALLPLILNSGVSEEIFSRLYIPLLMVLSGLDAGVAFVATTLIFGMLHRYQGWLGIVITTALGGIFAFLYLAGDGLWLPIAFHLFINFNSLLLRPAIKHFTTKAVD